MCDPWADSSDAKLAYGVDLVPLDEIGDVDALVVAVAHDKFVAMGSDDIKALFADKDDAEKVLVDVKSILNKADFEGFRYWRL